MIFSFPQIGYWFWTLILKLEKSVLVPHKTSGKLCNSREYHIFYLFWCGDIFRPTLPWLPKTNFFLSSVNFSGITWVRIYFFCRGVPSKSDRFWVRIPLIMIKITITAGRHHWVRDWKQQFAIFSSPRHYSGVWC